MSEHSSIVFAQQGSDVKMMRVISRPALKSIPPSVYGLKSMENEITFIFQKLKFDLPKKVYGSHNFYYDIITKDYASGNESLGVLLSGYKGCGKTLLAEMLGNWALNRALPVFHIHTKAVDVSEIYHTVKNTGPCCVIIDEFEKLYSDSVDVPNTQLHFLTMLSDASLKGVLWIFTANDTGDIASALTCRPGRLKYHIKSPALPISVIIGYLADRPDIVPVIKRCILMSFNVLISGQTYIFDHMRAICAIAPGYADPDAFYRHADMLNIPTLLKLKTINIQNEDPTVEVKAVYQDGVLEVTVNGAIIFSDDIVEHVIANGSHIPGLSGIMDFSKVVDYIPEPEIKALVTNFTGKEKAIRDKVNKYFLDNDNVNDTIGDVVVKHSESTSARAIVLNTL